MGRATRKPKLVHRAAPNISVVNGGSHNTLIVATSDGLIAVDAPGDDGQSKIVMDLAQQKYPGKTWKYLLLTHHHIDHVGGLRAFAAAGATIVVGKGDGAFYRKVLSAPETLNPYGTKQVPPKVEEVDGKWSVSDGGRTIEAYSLDNPHATGYIIPYIPDAKFGFVTDLWSPAPRIPPANPETISLVKGIQKMAFKWTAWPAATTEWAISPIWQRRCSKVSQVGNAWGRPTRSLPWSRLAIAACGAWRALY